ncbi:unnamed protein product [Schistosoma margrebowiei]|uniref:Uncharacterized protein n=1 Tax=Schistosoma margrebowiei TaxID=48269 RepID=A0A3P8ALB2_9TREM|nr:unnamed protein product [Schistosoma margrebowiei]
MKYINHYREFENAVWLSLYLGVQLAFKLLCLSDLHMFRHHIVLVVFYLQIIQAYQL